MGNGKFEMGETWAKIFFIHCPLRITNFTLTINRLLDLSSPSENRPDFPDPAIPSSFSLQN
jgi:hypothetical protein